MATAYDYIREATSKDYGTDVPANGLNRIHTVQRSVNLETACSDLKADVDFTSSDVIKIIDVPIDTWVVFVTAETVTAGDCTNLDIGDETTPAGWVEDVDMTAGEDDDSLDGVTYSLATAGGKFYTSADTIDIDIEDATDDGVLLVTALMVDVLRPGATR